MAKIHCEIQMRTIIVCAFYSIKYGKWGISHNWVSHCKTNGSAALSAELKFWNLRPAQLTISTFYEFFENKATPIFCCVDNFCFMISICGNGQGWKYFGNELNSLVIQFSYSGDLMNPEAVFLVMCNPSMNELWAT